MMRMLSPVRLDDLDAAVVPLNGERHLEYVRARFQNLEKDNDVATTELNTRPAW